MSEFLRDGRRKTMLSSMCDRDILDDAQLLFSYERVDDELEPRDVIIGFGNHSETIAKHAAALFHEGWANSILFTGGYGRITRHIWNMPEAERFAQIAVDLDVPRQSILLDTNASNTGENIKNSQRLLLENDLSDARAIVVELPFRGRRTRSALEIQWPQLDFIMTSPRLSFSDYYHIYSAHGPISCDDFISLLVGDIQRIIEYGARGWQTPQELPDEVFNAYRRLIERGFTSQMIPENHSA